MKKLHLFIFIVCGLLILCFFIVKTKHKNINDNTMSENINRSSGIKDINITKHFDDGLRSITLRAKWLGTEPSDIKLFKVSVFKNLAVKKVELLFREKDKTVSTITADKAVLRIPVKEPDKISAVFDNRIELYGNVKTVTSDRRSLFCDNLIIEPDKAILKGKGNCVFTNKGKRKKSSSCTSDIYLKNMKMKNKIKNFMNIFK